MANINLSPAEFAENFKNTPGSVLLDVRTPDEYNSGHLPGAINIDINGFDFPEKIEELDSQQEYFVYCRSGARSARACQFMMENGFHKVHNMMGGILAWQGEVE